MSRSGVRNEEPLSVRRVSLAAAGGVMLWLAVLEPAGAAERDLYSGLAYLRAGAQTRAEQHLTKYRNETRDPEIRRSIDQVLPLLKRPLSEDVREYIAASLEERVAAAANRPPVTSRPSYWSRMFPVFP